MVWTYAVAVLWGLSAASLTWGWLERRRGEQLTRRMERLGIRVNGEENRVSGPDTRGLARTVGTMLSKRWPSVGQRQRSVVEGSGIAGLTTEELIGWQALVALAGVLLGLLT
jgi:hypothetical protein